MIRKPLYFAGIAGGALLALSLVTAPTPASAQGTGDRFIIDRFSDELLFAAPESGGDHPELRIDGDSPDPAYEDSPRAQSQFNGTPPVPAFYQASPTPPSAANEKAWVEARVASLLGVPSVSLNVIGQPQQAVGGGSTGGTFAGPTGWVYALLKPDNFYVLYKNTTGGTNLVTDLFSNGISHGTYFVPLPAAAWLFLSALAGLVGWKRWFGDRREPAAA